MFNIKMETYGWNTSALTENAYQSGIPARITAVHRDRYEIVCCHGIVPAVLKNGVYRNGTGELFPTAGDFVVIQYEEYGDSLIIKTLPRRSFFSRRDPTPGRGEQAVAANFDYVFIMSSLNKDFNINKIERYLTLAWQSGGSPVILLTKADLPESHDEQINAAERIAFGVPVILVSIISGQGIEEISKILTPSKTAVFLGSSGVGKSSLVNALSGNNLMNVKEIREDDSRGRHTTTHRQLMLLPSGGIVIDTPGMRELGMWEISEGIKTAYADVEEILARGCKFSDCRHRTEPGCAVKNALQSGELPHERWQNYLKLQKEARFTDNKAAALEQKHKRNKEISNYVKQIKHNNY